MDEWERIILDEWHQSLEGKPTPMKNRLLIQMLIEGLAAATKELNKLKEERQP